MHDHFLHDTTVVFNQPILEHLVFQTRVVQLINDGQIRFHVCFMSTYWLHADQEPYIMKGVEVRPDLEAFKLFLAGNYKNRKGAMPKHFFSNASKKDMFYPCPPMRTDNNHIYLLLLCKF